MSIVEFHGGPVTHRYLMRKTRFELERMYDQNRSHGFGGLLGLGELRSMNKYDMATEVLRQFRRMPASEE